MMWRERNQQRRAILSSAPTARESLHSDHERHQFQSRPRRSRSPLTPDLAVTSCSRCHDKELLRIDEVIGNRIRQYGRQKCVKCWSKRAGYFAGLRQPLGEAEGDEGIERSPAKQLSRPETKPRKARSSTPCAECRRERDARAFRPRFSNNSKLRRPQGGTQDCHSRSVATPVVFED